MLTFKHKICKFLWPSTETNIEISNHIKFFYIASTAISIQYIRRECKSSAYQKDLVSFQFEITVSFMGRLVRPTSLKLM